MNRRPSTSSLVVVRVACVVLDRMLPASFGGGAAGSPKQSSPASRKRTATRMMEASGPAMRTTAGPSRANPNANAAFSVKVKSPFAEVSCSRRTSSGIIASSAGAKRVVMMLAKILSKSTMPRASTLPSMRKMAPARVKFATMSTSRLSSRSTHTPAIGERRTAGTRKLKKRALSVEVEPLRSATSTVSP